MTVAILLVVIAILFRCQPRRDYTLSVALLIAAFTWLAIAIRLLRLLRDAFALALEHWVETAIGLGAGILLIVPVTMLSVALRDQFDRKFGREGDPSHGRIRSTVLNNFERRVATLMALGYGRTQAEGTAFCQMKRDLCHPPATGQPSNRSA